LVAGKAEVLQEIAEANGKSCPFEAELNSGNCRQIAESQTFDFCRVSKKSWHVSRSQNLVIHPQ
jgi:hypothetical protein